MTTVGFLYPGHFADDDFPRMEVILDTTIRLVVNRTEPGEDDHRTGTLRQRGAPERLAAGVEELRRAGAESVVWASTGGSCVYGWEGAREQSTTLARAAGLPASSTSLAFVHAVQGLGVARVAVAAPWSEETAGLFTGLLSSAGVDVVATHSGGAATAAEAAAWSVDRLKELVVAADRPEAGAVLLPGNAVHTAAHIRDLEELLSKPVLTANQVAVFEALRLARRRAWAPQLGALFAAREAPPAPAGRTIDGE
ncbi:decarboxylase [Streptomyces sp. LN785]|uniref:maleate cis-trans isomerase family protein n=1 Tax=Streptomyces sp. LN785 TaxID=3112983 RepID=UPI003721D0A5